MTSSDSINQEPEDLQALQKPFEGVFYRSEELFQGRSRIVIEHGKAQYRLQITKAGKLILNK